MSDALAVRKLNEERQRLLDERDKLLEALTECYQLATVALDAIWHKSVEPTQILHDYDDPESATTAFNKMFLILRPFIHGADALAQQPTEQAK